MIDTKSLQAFLRDEGFPPGDIDGLWGEASRAMALGFALARGDPRIVHWTADSARVAVEQAMLAKAGLYAGIIDGKVGPKTEAARKAWGSVPAKAPKKTLVAVIGLAAASLLGLTLDRWEGNESVGYRDVVGIATNCRGNTTDVAVGRRYSDAECTVINDREALKHVEPILACAPRLRTAKPEIVAAHASLAYNIGTTGWCGSTAARRLNAGDWAGSCEAIMLWQMAGGRIVKGLTNRRTAERALCRKGL